MSELPEGRKPLLWSEMQFADRPKGHPSTEALEIQKLQSEARDMQSAILWHEARAIRAIDEAKALRARVAELEAALQKIDVGEGWAALIARAALQTAPQRDDGKAGG